MNTVHPLATHPEVFELLKWIIVAALGVISFFIMKWYDKTMSGDAALRREGIEKIWPEMGAKMEELMATNGTLQGLIEAKIEATEEKVTLMGADIKEIQKNIVPKSECEDRHASQGVKIDVVLHELKQLREEARERDSLVRDFLVIMGKNLLLLCKLQEQDCEDVRMMVEALNRMKMNRMGGTQ